MRQAPQPENEAQEMAGNMVTLVEQVEMHVANNTKKIT